ncbi:MAG: hypothetical protein NZ746_11325 [Blastocatellia bacterium]|nr:hypothetical protein [Blastocatellia bacterium]MDW8256564.1 hypothetical protein [Acidobacteriota bacterium]
MSEDLTIFRRAVALFTKAAEASRQRDHARARELLQQAARLYRDLVQQATSPDQRVRASRGLGAALFHLAIEALYVARPVEVLDAAQEGYALIAQYGLQPARQLAKLNAIRALALLDLQRLSEALHAVEAAFEDLLKEKDSIVRAEMAVRFTWLKGMILSALSRHEEALEHLERAYAHFQNCGQYNFWHFVGMAEALMAVGRREDALAFYRIGVDYLKQSGAFVPFSVFRVEMLVSV